MIEAMPPKPNSKPSSSTGLARQQLPVSHEPINSTRIVPVPNGLMAKVQEAFGLEREFQALLEQERPQFQVALTYPKMPRTDGPAAATIEKKTCLNLDKYYELLQKKFEGVEARQKLLGFCDQIKQHLSDLFELTYRYLHEYRAPKHNLRWWRDGLSYLERSVIGVGQIIGVGLYASSESGAGGIACSVGSALIGLAGELVANHWRKQEESYFKMRDELDGKLSTLLSFYSQPETADVLCLFQTIIVDVLGYIDSAIMEEKLKKSWPHIQSYFPKNTSTTVVTVAKSSTAASGAGREPDE